MYIQPGVEKKTSRRRRTKGDGSRDIASGEFTGEKEISQRRQRSGAGRSIALFMPDGRSPGLAGLSGGILFGGSANGMEMPPGIKLTPNYPRKEGYITYAISA